MASNKRPLSSRIQRRTEYYQCSSSSMHHQNRQSFQNFNYSSQYDRIRVLGKGSFGTAVVHRRHADSVLVVFKEIELNKFKGEAEYMSAINEARIMSKLNHSNIIRYYNAYLTETKLIIEMEYAEMGTLSAYLSLQAQPLDEYQVLVIFRQIGSGLAYLHSMNIIHLDLKMANIFLTNEGLVKIGDFGIAQFLYTSNKCNLNKQQTCPDVDISEISVAPPEVNQRYKWAPDRSFHLGTLAYSSPERCLGHSTDYKSDIWSIGCILYELITGRPLFVAGSLVEMVLAIGRIEYQPIKRNVSSDLLRMFQKIISREPENRPTAQQLVASTDRLLSMININRNRISPGRQLASQNIRRLLEQSTEFAMQAKDSYNEHLNQINYFHSLVYQIRLDERPIRVDRVNLPPTKRIKEMVKGKSHYLVLTYDNVVYGWGSRHLGQLGGCNLGSSGSRSQQWRLSRRCHRSARSSVDDAFWMQKSPSSSTVPSPASSTQTLTQAASLTSFQTSPSLSASRSGQLVMDALKESQPTQKPFVINELNHRKIVQVAAGDHFSVFLSKTGIVMTCGDGSSGCLGRGNWISSYKPCMVESLLDSDVVSISCGPKHVVAVCGSGRAYAWGKSANGRLGIGRSLSGSGKNGTNIVHRDHPGTDYILRPQEVKLPRNVLIKSVVCGDRCSIFIDSRNRCWACGRNRSNKLGLDIKRRFKSTIVIEESWTPVEVIGLRKYKVVSCRLAKNHAAYLTIEGRLIVLGQDIDYTYRLEHNIICKLDSYRQMRYELKAGNDSVHSSTDTSGQSGYLKRMQLNRHLNYWHLSTNSVLSNNPACKAYPRHQPQSSGSFLPYSTMANQRRKQHWKSYIKKSRAFKKMSLENVISIACCSRFTIALTHDNRVYFWGTRSYDETSSCSWSSSSPDRRQRRKSKLSNIEPQLMSSHTMDDQCLVKIGITNNSLMNDIEDLGCDQPIIQAQDPHLVAKSLADLWILDYHPKSGASSCSSCSSSNLSSSPCTSLCSLSSDCCSKLSKKANHDAILEPQPILSLYKPSMFNNRHCCLRFEELFCFDEDCFYLILDTSIRVDPMNRSTGSRTQLNLPMSAKQDLNDQTDSHDSMLNNDQVRATSFRATTVRSLHDLNVAKYNHKNDILLDSEDVKRNTLLDVVKADNVHPEIMRDNPALPTSSPEMKPPDLLIESNDDQHSTIHPPETGSNSGLSLEEPRSLSTFANSMGNQVVLWPSMRSLNQVEQQLPMQTLRFEEGDSVDFEVNDLMFDEIPPALRLMEGKRRNHRVESGSESTTNTLNELESSMPSWVRNEFIQHQQENQTEPSSSPKYNLKQSVSSPETSLTSGSSTAVNEQTLQTNSRGGSLTRRGSLAQTMISNLNNSFSVSQPNLEPDVWMPALSRTHNESDNSSKYESSSLNTSLNVDGPLNQSVPSLFSNNQHLMQRSNLTASLTNPGVSNQQNTHINLSHVERRLSWPVQMSNQQVTPSCDQSMVQGNRKAQLPGDSSSSNSSQTIYPNVRANNKSNTNRASNLSISSLRKSLIKLFCS